MSCPQVMAHKDSEFLFVEHQSGGKSYEEDPVGAPSAAVEELILLQVRRGPGEDLQEAAVG